MKKDIKKETSLEEVSQKQSDIIVAQQPQMVNFDPANQVEFAQKAAKALMVVIDATKPLVMQGKRYLYFEHWQTIARFFNTTVGTSETIKDENGYIAKAIVYNKDGVVIGGAEASCMKDEQNWKNKPDFQLRSMAQTRAMAKALRSMYGFVAVLAGIEATPAEEMAGQDFGHQTVSFPPSDKQMETIKKNMAEKNITEAELMDDGFPALKDLTGGKEGTASELIGHLFSISKYSNGLRPLDEQQQLVSAFIKRLEDCDTYKSYEFVVGEIKFAKENGKLDNNSFAILVKVCKEVINKWQKLEEAKEPSLKDKAMAVAQEIRDKRDNTPAGIVEKFGNK